MVTLCPEDLENGLAGESASPGSFSERDKMDEAVVEDALDEVDKNELTELPEELPEVDLEEDDDDDDPEPDRDDVGV